MGGREARVLAVASVARLHVGGLGLAVLLLVEGRTASFADGGLAVALLSIGVAVARIVQGRVIDRVGVAGLPVIAALHAAGALLVLAAPDAFVPGAVLLLGLTAPAITVVTRWLWARDVGTDRQPLTFGVDNALQDAAFVVGPLLAAAVADVTTPGAALLVLVAIGCAGGVGLALVIPRGVAHAAAPGGAARPGVPNTSERGGGASSSARAGGDASSGARPRGERGGALRPVLRVLVATAGLGVIYGALGVGAVAVAVDAGRDDLSGVVTAALFAGGIVGDLVLAPRRPSTPLAQRLRSRVPVLLVACALVPLAPGVLGVTVAVALTGAVLANASVTLLLDLAARAAPAARAEGFGWAGATLRLGNAAGAASAGLLAEHVDARSALAVAVAGAALASAVVLRRTVQHV